MKDIFIIIKHERQTIFKGIFISFLIVLPFTFIPDILKYGFSFETVKNRFYLSTIYSLAFATIVVFVAFHNNIKNLIIRKNIYTKPALDILNFEGSIYGLESIFSELETRLFGKYKNYQYEIRIVNPDENIIKIQIIPSIKLNKSIIKILKEEMNFKFDYLSFGLILTPSKDDLNNEKYFLEILENLNEKLKELKIDYQELEIK